MVVTMCLPRAILGMPVVALSGALQDGFRVLSDTGDPPLLVYDAHDPEGRDA